MGDAMLEIMVAQDALVYEFERLDLKTLGNMSSVFGTKCRSSDCSYGERMDMESTP